MRERAHCYIICTSHTSTLQLDKLDDIIPITLYLIHLLLIHLINILVSNMNSFDSTRPLYVVQYYSRHVEISFLVRILKSDNVPFQGPWCFTSFKSTHISHKIFLRPNYAFIGFYSCTKHHLLSLELFLTFIIQVDLLVHLKNLY